MTTAVYFIAGFFLGVVGDFVLTYFIMKSIASNNHYRDVFLRAVLKGYREESGLEDCPLCGHDPTKVTNVSLSTAPHP